MRSAFFLLTAAAVALSGCAGSGTALSPDPSLDPLLVARLHEVIDETMAEHNIPGAVIDLRIPGSGHFLVAKGMSNTQTGQPMRIDNHFRIGSNTKGFTGTVILKLVDEGRLTLDQKVSTLLEGVPNGENITVRQLLNMTSGLPNYSETDAFNDILWTNPYYSWTRDELLQWAYAQPNNFDPGTEWEYSNTNTVLLGMIIETLTGMTTAQAFQNYLYQPLGMRNTSWPTTGALPTPYAYGYTDDNPDRVVVDATHWNPNWADSAGQLVSNVSDLRIWARALGTGSLISPQMQQERLTWVTGIPGATGNYGLAIGRSGPWLHHQGELPGYNTIAAYNPSLDATLVVLTNSNVPFDAMGPAARLTMAISQVLAEL